MFQLYNREMFPFSTLIAIFGILVSVSSISPPSFAEEMAALQYGGPRAYAALHGCTLDTHKVLTRDGWIIEVFRLRNMEVYRRRVSSPILLSHGAWSSGMDFFTQMRNESLAFILADHGLDVWVMNYRATIFSNRTHVNGTECDPEGEDYYDATWQRMAEHDLPSTIDMILRKTRRQSLHLVGHSMGYTVISAMLSDKPEYAQKIGYLFGLAPVIRLDENTPLETQTLLGLVNKFVPSIPKGEFELLAGTRSVDSVLKTEACNDSSICLILSKMNAVNESDRAEFRKERAPLEAIYETGGITLLNIFQFARQLKRENWSKLNYTEIPQTGKTNEAVYGSDNVPIYNFTMGHRTMKMYFVEEDRYLGRGTDEKILQMLGNPPYSYIAGEGISHSGMIRAWNARCFIYNDLLETLINFEKERNYQKRYFHERIVPSYVKSLHYADGCVKPRSPEATTVYASE